MASGTANLSTNLTLNQEVANLSANCKVMIETYDDTVSLNFLVGVDIHAYAQIFQFKGSEASTSDLHNDLTIWLNSQDLTNTTVQSIQCIPYGLQGHFIVVLITS